MTNVPISVPRQHDTKELTGQQMDKWNYNNILFIF